MNFNESIISIDVYMDGETALWNTIIVFVNIHFINYRDTL